jgi:hypothetical protein
MDQKLAKECLKEFENKAENLKNQLKEIELFISVIKKYVIEDEVIVSEENYVPKKTQRTLNDFVYEFMSQRKDKIYKVSEIIKGIKKMGINHEAENFDRNVSRVFFHPQKLYISPQKGFWRLKK